MNRRFYFSILAFALTLSVALAFVAGRSTTVTRAAASTGAALAALPQSDFVIAVDVERALNETLPTILAANPTALAKLNAKLAEFEKETGVNPRTFQTIAIGGRLNRPHPHGEDAVIIARGSFNAEQLLDTAFTTAKSRGEKFQKEETQYEGRRIFLVSSTREVKTEVEAGKEAAQATLSSEPKSGKMAVAILDANTLAIGSPEGARSAVDASLGRNRVDDELVRLASQTPNAVFSFAGRVPRAATEKAAARASGAPFEKYFASIREFYGSFSADGSEADTTLALRTETNEQAADLVQAINGLKALTGIGLFASKGDSEAAKAISDILKGLSINTQGNEVQFNLRIPQSSLAPFVRHF